MGDSSSIAGLVLSESFPQAYYHGMILDSSRAKQLGAINPKSPVLCHYYNYACDYSEALLRGIISAAQRINAKVHRRGPEFEDVARPSSGSSTTANNPSWPTQMSINPRG